MHVSLYRVVFCVNKLSFYGYKNHGFVSDLSIEIRYLSLYPTDTNNIIFAIYMSYLKQIKVRKYNNFKGCKIYFFA